MQLDCVSFQNCRPCKRGGAAVPTMLALSGLSSVRTFETHSSRHLRVPSCLSLLREHVYSTRPGAMDRVDDRSHRRVAPLSIPRPGAPPAVLPESSPRNGIHPSRLPVESLRLPVSLYAKRISLCPMCSVRAFSRRCFFGAPKVRTN